MEATDHAVNSLTIAASVTKHSGETIRRPRARVCNLVADQ